MKKYILLLSITTLIFAACSKDAGTANAPGAISGDAGSTGQGGSLARFTTAMDHLYVVDGEKLYSYSLANSTKPQLKGSIEIGSNIETIYSYKDKLFIGSQNAMYVYSLTDPAYPTKLGEASHVRSCDPVIADDKYAYVTVRGGSACGGNNNALYVYDVSNVLYPKQLDVRNMESPFGLGMKGDMLYVCEGTNGLKLFDITDRANPQLKLTVSDDTYYDVIVYDDLLICMVQGGTLLYEIRQDGYLIKKAKISG